jgi:hypothetical protein
MYRDELTEAIRQGDAARAAMEAWVNRPVDAADVPGAVLEGYAKALRASRETLRRLLSEHGVRDDIDEALTRNEEHHRALGLSIRDKLEPIEEDAEDDLGLS